MNDVYEKCADWWAERFQIDGKRSQFRAELLRRLEENCLADDDIRDSCIRLSVDYDPQGTLLDVIREIGIDCRGSMFSADGILPPKRWMRIYSDGLVEVCDGRGPRALTILVERPA